MSKTIIKVPKSVRKQNLHTNIKIFFLHRAKSKINNYF